MLVLALLPFACSGERPRPATASISCLPPVADSAAVSYKLVSASIERGGGMVEGPTFAVTVDRSGRVDYDGSFRGQVLIHRVAMLTPAQLEALQQAFQEAEYFRLTYDYERVEVTEMPTVVTSFRSDGASASVRHNPGCLSVRGVAALTSLENKFDKIVDAYQFMPDLLKAWEQAQARGQAR